MDFIIVIVFGSILVATGVMSPKPKDDEIAEAEVVKTEEVITPPPEIKQHYSSSQMVNEDGYCFIGTDNNMRQCVNAYKGDICTSGDIYKRIDDCLIPKIAHNSQFLH